MPSAKDKRLMPAAAAIMPLKLRASRRAVMAGKMIKLEISMAPIMRMPSTTVTAVRKEIIKW